jgi:cytochrome c-type biogenesis protein CcmH
LSIALVVGLLGMTTLALAVLLLPLLWRQRRAGSRDAYNLAVYRDQLAEIERDLTRGLLSAEQAAAARTEIGRRILALQPESDSGAAPHPPIAASLAILLLPLAAGLIYWQLGSPALPDQPFAARAGGGSETAAGAGGHADINEALARLDAHLKDHPEDLAGWLLLGRSDLSLGRYREAAEAYRHADDLSGHRGDVSGDWGEALVLAAGGTVTPEAKKAFEAALADPDTAPKAHYYLALAQLQQGDAKGALEAWRDLAADAPGDADWLPLVQQRIAEAAKTLGIDPTSLKSPGAAPPHAPAGAELSAAAKAAAGASPEARQAMIDAMVERLQAKLAQQPDDVDGWALLGRSYMVLRQPDKARDAYTRALELKPTDPALKKSLIEAATAAAGQAAAAAPAQKDAK